MTDFPEETVTRMLSRFGIEAVDDLKPWPFPDLSNDLLAEFQYQDRGYLLKRRPVEQRGERSLFETQFIQKELHRLGIPVPVLWVSPDDETLLSGPDWEGDGKTYFEIQEKLPGSSFHLQETTALAAGRFLGTFHEAGSRIDTFLLNKGYWIRDFTKRREASVSGLGKLLRSTSLSGADTRLIEKLLERSSSFLSISARTWGLDHGNMCSNNLLSKDGAFFLIDIEEIGLGEVWGDIFPLLNEVPDVLTSVIHPLIEGYREGGGTLSREDLIAISDTFTMSYIEKVIGKSEAALEIPQILNRFEFIKDL